MSLTHAREPPTAEKRREEKREDIREERTGERTEERRGDTHGAGREGRGGRGRAGRDGGGGRVRGHEVLRDPLEHLAHASARRRARLAQLRVMACTSARQEEYTSTVHEMGSKMGKELRFVAPITADCSVLQITNEHK